MKQTGVRVCRLFIKVHIQGDVLCQIVHMTVANDITIDDANLRVF